MSSPSTREHLITGEELARMGDLGRCELIDGRVVRMNPTNPRHGQIEVRIAAALEAFVRPRRLGRVLAGEVGVYTHRDPDRVRGADVIYITSDTFARRSPTLAFLDVAPELVVEVLSPEDRAVELNQKLREYFALGVNLVWLADPVARTVQVYRSPSDVREAGESDVLSGEDMLPGFEVSVASLFEEE
jgi:Uma2 family endonuclease